MTTIPPPKLNATGVFTALCVVLAVLRPDWRVDLSAQGPTGVGYEPPPPCCDGCDNCPDSDRTGYSAMSLSEGTLKEDFHVVTVKSAYGATIDLSLAYTSANADGSKMQVDTGMGYGWTHPYNVFLFVQTVPPPEGPEHFYRMDGLGRTTRFTNQFDGTYLANIGYFETLTVNGGTIAIRDKHGNVSTFAEVPGTQFPAVFSTGPIYRLTSLIDRNGNTTTLEYTDGLLTRIVDPFARALELTYTLDRHLQTVSDPASRNTLLEYEGPDLKKITDPEGHFRAYTYNAQHQLIAKADRDQRAFDYQYVNGKPVAIQDMNNQVVFSLANAENWGIDPEAFEQHLSREYVPATTEETDGRNKQWRHSYDKQGYLTAVEAPDGAVTTYTYDENTYRVQSMTDANLHTTSYEYDALTGNRTSVKEVLEDGTEYVTNYQYELVFNQLIEQTDPNPGRPPTKYEYDNNGNRTKEIDSLGEARQWTYDSRGNVLTETDKRNKVTRHEYDAAGNRIKTTDPLNQVTTFTYDAVGNLISRTDPKLHTTEYRYDRLDRLVEEENPLHGVTETRYDGEGYRRFVIDANTNQTEFEYDERGRLFKTTDMLGSFTLNAYDNANNLISTTDKNNHTTVFEYDDQNRLTKTIDALGHATAKSYDDVGNVERETDANLHTTTHEYDALNRRVRTIDAVGGTTEFFYDMVGLAGCPTCTGPTLGSSIVTKQIDGNLKVTYFKYDALDRLLLELRKVGDDADLADPDDAITQYSYDANGNRLSVIDPNANATTFVYDALNRVTTSTNAEGEKTTMKYDKAGNVASVKAPNLNVTKNTYDANDRVTQVKDLDGVISKYTYDAAGNQLTEKDGNNNTTRFAYDELNRIRFVTDPLGHPSEYRYDRVGNLIEVIDREGRQTAHEYDDVNRRVRTTETGPNGPGLILTTEFQYDDVGNLLTIVDANGNATNYTYDEVNQRISETYADPAPNVRTYGYDFVGNLVIRTDQKAQTTAYVYDDLHRLVLRDYPVGDDDAFAYDLAGRMTKAVRGAWVVNLLYDKADRMISSEQGGKAVLYTYKTLARKRQVTYPGTRLITEATDYRRRNTKITDGGTVPIATYSYDPANRTKKRTLRNGTVATYAYDTNDRVLALVHRLGTATLVGFDHGYDKEGNKQFEKRRHDLTDSEAYAYDEHYRLIDYKVGELVGSIVPVPNTQTAYELDPVGNWNSKTTDGTPENRTHNPANEITAIDAMSVWHDDNGNLTDDGTRTYAYDVENRLVQVTRKADSAVLGQYVYDAFGRRVVKFEPVTSVETRYFYDGWRVVEEQNAAGVTQATYVYGNYFDEVLTMNRGGQSLYYHQNTLFSVHGLSDASGALVEGYQYDAYGRQTVFTPGANGVVNFGGDDIVFVGGASSLGNPYTFTGRELDRETGLLVYRARVYDPAFGRFLTRDPIAYEGDGMNLYEYVSSAPTRWMDPTGLDETDTVPLKDFWDKWKKDHPGFNPADYAKIFDTIDRGCIGITCAALGEPGIPDASNCYSTFEEVTKREREMVKKDECCKKGKKNAYGRASKPRIFSIRFWSKGRAYGPDPKTSKVDMRGWIQDVIAKTAAKPGHTNFDYGLYDKTTGRWTHANHSEPGMEVYVSDLEGYSRPLADFDKQVFCVACEDWRLTGYGKKEDEKKKEGKKGPNKKVVIDRGIR
jgi:RHS repeat-associated protein